MEQNSKDNDLRELNHSLNSLKSLSQETKEILNKKNSRNIFKDIQKQIIEILNIFLILDEDIELQHKLKIYSYVGNFIKEKIDKENNNYDTCLSAALFLCKEIDRELYVEDLPSENTKNLISKAKEQIVAIKTHYYINLDNHSCAQKTEIFSLLTGKSKPTITKIEETGILIENLPDEIKSIFYKENKELISFQIYP